MSRGWFQDEDHLKIQIFSSRRELGRVAALDVAAELRSRLARKDQVRMIFAAAPSQREMLSALSRQAGIDWRRVVAFHMDEYIGLPPHAPQLFSEWLRSTIFDRAPFAEVHAINPDPDPEAACRRYASLLRAAPIDLCLLGIGVNGHLAFNDPPADLEDPKIVKIVTLDVRSRQQQVDEGCFAALDEVPMRAVTLTIPALLAARSLFCCVSGRFKAEAVRSMITDEIGGASPATALRRHDNCRVYLDRESAALLHEDARRAGSEAGGANQHPPALTRLRKFK